MRLATLLVVTLGSGAALAQSPQMVWRGDVRGSVRLLIQDQRAQVDSRSGSVSRPDPRFYEPLPRIDQDVRLNMRQGRGSVRILEQPRARNNYLLSLAIDDPQGDSYEIEFFWRSDSMRGTPSGSPSQDRYPPANYPNSRYTPRGNEDTLDWSGQVDGEVVLEVRGRRVNVLRVRGEEVYGDRYDFSRQLPLRRAANVRLADRQGRGTIELVEQPSARNNFTARVRIRDVGPGAAPYAFTLAWNRPNRGDLDADSRYENNDLVLDPYADNNTNRNRNNPAYPDNRRYDRRGPGTLSWSGRVDGRIRVSVRGDQAYATTLQGRDVAGDRFTFTNPLPSLESRDLTLRKLRGRGEVVLVEYPNPGNGFQAVFEINDPEGGADDYAVELSWQ